MRVFESRIADKLPARFVNRRLIRPDGLFYALSKVNRDAISAIVKFLCSHD